MSDLDEDSDQMPLDPPQFHQGNQEMISPQDFYRLEKKVDRLTSSLDKLLLFEERQKNQGERVGDIETDVGGLKTKIEGIEKSLQEKIETIDKKVDRWINRGIGVWALAVALFTIFQTFVKH
jgi:hypothetical protein